MSEYRTLWIEADSELKERKKMLGDGTISEPDKYQVDGQKLAADIAHACNAADDDGYEIISILPIDRGQDEMGANAHSITDGVILAARKKK